MKKTISNARNLILLSLITLSSFFLSCEKTENQIKIRINQFKQTAVAPYGPVITLSAQQGNEIGSANWSAFYDQIVGFDYEAGYVYDILVVETEILNPPADGNSKAYQLKQILSKTKVDESVTFNLTLKNDLINYVKGDAVSGYTLLDEADIDCGTLCTEFANALQSNSKLINGKFCLNSNGSIKLVEIL
ncbi:DUF4377 domain-containing protein [Pedobacter frigiditerrae]|uniref:DUF4377 domain-containing protein n=1 Tax=Pedobacter frigiditerrae TaxID=2530452 RepID=UPI00293044C8|nr:DUF4377 domain-containing protein [Pedobacter frigiditerrae]